MQPEKSSLSFELLACISDCMEYYTPDFINMQEKMIKK